MVAHDRMQSPTGFDVGVIGAKPGKLADSDRLWTTGERVTVGLQAVCWNS
jgi:NADPH-dependent glutamate synthase beta subunit-like oxidoreductase